MRNLIFALAFVLPSFHLRAALIEASGLDWTSVSNAVASAVEGDVVLLPRGQAQWTNQGIQISGKRIHIVGKNTPVFTNETKITVNTGTSVPFSFLSIPTSSTTNFGISYVTLDMNQKTPAQAVNIGSGNQTTNKGFRVHHMHVDNIRVRGINTLGGCEGLVDANWTRQSGNFQAQNFTFQGYNRATTRKYDSNHFGNPTLGVTNNMVFAERNYSMAEYAGDSSLELYFDAWVTARSNYFQTTAGIHDNGTNRVATVWDFYDNTFDITAIGAVRWFVVRSGWGNIWNNIVTFSGSLNTNITTQFYRASGTNVFQNYYAVSSVSVAPSPPDSGTSLTIQVAERARFRNMIYPQQMIIWPAGALYSDGGGEDAIATAYNTNTAVVTLTRGSPARTILVGDQVALSQVLAVNGTNQMDFNGNNATIIGYPSMDQPGWGDPIVWSATNLLQTFYGGYSWNNSINGNTNIGNWFPYSFCNSAFGVNCNSNLLAYDGIRTLPQTEDLVVEGRDVFSNTARPAYTPLDAHPMAIDIVISPASTNIVINGSVDFAHSNNYGTAFYVLSENNSGGTINQSTGVYTAGSIPSVTDVIQVVDQIGGSSFAYVSVSENPVGSISPGVGFLLRR